MRRSFSIALVLFGIIICQAQVKIGDNPNAIQASSLLELESTTKGLLLPRVNPNNVSNPVAGMFIYDIITQCVRVHNGSTWSDCVSMNSSGGSDQIQANLTTSLAAYNAAAPGTWLLITAAEFAALESNLLAVTRSGTTAAEFNTPPAGFNWGAATSANAGSPMPEGSYLFAFKYRPGGAKALGDKIKISNSGPLSGYADVGSVLPAHSGSTVHFVLKGSSTATAAAAFLGYFTLNNAQVGFKNNGGVFYAATDATALPNVTANFQVLMQGLSSTIKQW